MACEPEGEWAAEDEAEVEEWPPADDGMSVRGDDSGWPGILSEGAGRRVGRAAAAAAAATERERERERERRRSSLSGGRSC